MNVWIDLLTLLKDRDYRPIAIRSSFVVLATILAAILEKPLSSGRGHLGCNLELIYINYITFLIVSNDLLT